MNYSYVLFLLICILFAQCNTDTDGEDPTMDCLELQKDVDEATIQKLDALEAYVKDTDNPVLCELYKESLLNRIHKSQILLESGCLSPGAYAATALAISEDQEEADGLDC